MARIRSYSKLKDDPRVINAAKNLGISKAEMIGHLHMLWWWAAEYVKDGDLRWYGDKEIAEACGWAGDADKFIKTLVNCGTPNHGVLEYTNLDSDELKISGWDEIYVDI